MLRSGRPWSDFNPPGAVDAQACLRFAEQEILARVDDLHRNRIARFEAFKAVRRGTVEATFGMRIDRQRARLADMENRSVSDRGVLKTLPIHRARLEQLESERTVQLNRIDDLKLGTVTYSVLGAGFVNVVEIRAVSGGR